MSTTKPAIAEAPRSQTVCLFLALMTLAVFWPILTHDFVNLDDGIYVTENSRVYGGLSLPAAVWAFTTVQYDNWLPLTLISHMIDAQLFSLHPYGHHLTSLLIHAANVLLLFLALRRMTANVWRSAFVAAVFAVHPLQVESVAWVAERKNVLSSFFCLVALRSYAAYAERPSRGRYAPVLLSFAAALLSKASAVTLPCLLLLLDYWPLERLRKGWRPPLVEKAPLFALGAAAGAAALLNSRLKTLTDLPLGSRLANALVSCADYLRKAVWPSGLAVFYPHPGGSLNLLPVLGAAFLLAGVSLAAVRFRREKPCLLAGWLWFLIALAPMLGLVQVGDQAMADRYAYFPLIGLAVMAAWAVPSFPGRGARGPALASAGLVSALMVAAGLQVRYWRDSVALFERALAVNESNALAHAALGCALSERGETARAATHYRRALEIEPRIAAAHNNLGVALAAQGDISGAAAQFSEAARLFAPNDPNLPGARENLAKARSRLGRGKQGR